MKPWEILEKKEVYSCTPWIRVWREKVKLPDGRIIEDYHRVAFHDYVSIVAETEEGEIIFLRQYRHGIGSESLLVAGGVIDDGEDPLETAKRELMEETGYHSDEWKSLGCYSTSPSYGCGLGYFYYARNSKKVKEADPGDLEEMELLLMPRGEVTHALHDGRIKAVGAVTALTLALSGL